MKKTVILGSLIIATNFFAQKKKNTLNNWQNNDAKIAQDIFSKYRQNSKSSEKLKKKLLQSQKILKIEILNEGELEKFNQTAWFQIIKINDGKFDQILETDNSGLELVKNSSQTNNWKDENGNVSFSSISEPLKISQEFTSAINNKGELKSPLKSIEIFETSSPVISFTFQIYTNRKDNNPTIKTEMVKMINIYADGKLIKILKYSYADLRKIGGISLKNFQVGEVE